MLVERRVIMLKCLKVRQVPRPSPVEHRHNKAGKSTPHAACRLNVFRSGLWLTARGVPEANPASGRVAQSGFAGPMPRFGLGSYTLAYP